MKQIIKELVDVVKGKSFEDAFKAVDQYLNSFWCIESDEWNQKMSDKEKTNLVNALLNFKK